MEEGKRIDFSFDSGKFVLKVDMNRDGESLLEVHLNLAEVPDEIIALFKSKKEEEVAE